MTFFTSILFATEDHMTTVSYIAQTPIICGTDYFNPSQMTKDSQHVYPHCQHAS
jgi:hypothetical protein